MAIQVFPSKKPNTPIPSPLAEAILQELAWRCTWVLRPYLLQSDPMQVIRSLAEPLEHGPYAFRIEQIMADISNAMHPAEVPNPVLLGSIVLSLHFPLVQAYDAGHFCPVCNSTDAVLGTLLTLHRPQIWQIAGQLAPFFSTANDAAIVQSRLYGLREQLFAQPHEHRIGSMRDLLSLPVAADEDRVGHRN